MFQFVGCALGFGLQGFTFLTLGCLRSLLPKGCDVSFADVDWVLSEGSGLWGLGWSSPTPLFQTSRFVFLTWSRVKTFCAVLSQEVRCFAAVPFARTARST